MKLRKLRGIKQKELAEALGVSETTVRNWERGRAIPQLTIPQTKTLCRILQCSLDEIPDRLGPQEESEQESPLKMLRQQAGLTQAELARQVSSTGGKLISERMVQDWEEGMHQPELSIAQVRALCQALELSFEELADYLETPQQRGESES